ncbi:MAG TPA: SRPBCC domain-containing protein [Candidatus Xenobia bacterium]|nr:SRPBCC domain-containing protein [Candidatus Xenobia bacterium]
MKNESNAKYGGISDAALRKATGKGWEDWFEFLDAAKAHKLGHKDIVDVLYKKHKNVDGWWLQMITVGYEQARGLRVRHQKPGGFEISSSKTVNVPVARLFMAFHDSALRRRWLKDSNFTIRKATPPKSLRITWVDGATHLDVNFYPKGDTKSYVSLQHGKLADSRAAEKQKVYWGQQLERLKQMLEAQVIRRAWAAGP